MNKIRKPYFEGTYYKHQKDSHTLCVIAGRAEEKNFIQIITENFSGQFPYNKECHFSDRGIVLDIHTETLTLRGMIRCGTRSPIRYDIMGIFRFFPMECRHEVVSMRHRLFGSVCLNGERIDFTGGTGYIERDSGRSFPSEYAWVQANDFQEPCAVMAAIARIPFCGLHFRGCICIIQYRGKEYRLATYLGVRILTCTPRRIVLQQGKYRLDIRIQPDTMQQSGRSVSSQGVLAKRTSAAFRELRAPENGSMTRTIREAPCTEARFCFYRGKEKLFDLVSHSAGAEYEFSS